MSGFSDTTYSAVTGLAYDETNKKLGLKVGADTVIPFSGSNEIFVFNSRAGWYTALLFKDGIVTLYYYSASSGEISNINNDLVSTSGNPITTNKACKVYRISGSTTGDYTASDVSAGTTTSPQGSENMLIFVA